MHIDVTLKVAVTLNNSHLTGKHLRGNNRKVITVIFLQDTSWFDSVLFEARHENLSPGAPTRSESRGIVDYLRM